MLFVSDHFVSDIMVECTSTTLFQTKASAEYMPCHFTYTAQSMPVSCGGNVVCRKIFSELKQPKQNQALLRFLYHCCCMFACFVSSIPCVLFFFYRAVTFPMIENKAFFFSHSFYTLILHFFSHSQRQKGKDLSPFAIWSSEGWSLGEMSFIIVIAYALGLY